MAIGWATGGLTLLGMAAGVVRRDMAPALCATCLAAGTAHASLLYSAILAAGISRFAIGAWPATMTGLLIGVWYVSRRLVCATRRT
jgi:hypothetical protein